MFRILSPTSSYFPVEGTGSESILHVVKSVVVQNSVPEVPLLMSADIYSDAAIGVYLWEHVFRGIRLIADLNGRRSRLISRSPDVRNTV